MGKGRTKGRKAFTSLPTTSPNNTDETIRDTVRNAWAAKSFLPTSPTPPTPQIAKTESPALPEVNSFDSEFPALPGSENKTSTGKENLVSPVDLNNGGWGQAENHGATVETTMSTVKPEWEDFSGGWGRPEDSRAVVQTTAQPQTATSEWVDLTVPPTEAELLKARVDKACEGWPWAGCIPNKLVTLAPYHMNSYPDVGEGPLALPRVVQQSPLFTKLLKVEDVRFYLMKFISPHHSAASALATTCQDGWDAVCSGIDIWDMTSGYFHNCDKMVTHEDAHPFRAGSVSAHLVITPLRRPNGLASYKEQVLNLRKLKMAILNFGSSLRNVQFHRVPFISINNLKLLIPHMTNLETLGIYNCQLLHLANGKQLIELLSVDRLKGKEHSIALDWYPCYHLGPEGSDRVGTYAVAWDNLNRDLMVCIWSLARRIVMKAQQHGIDFESPHTMFRQWLEKTGCWAIGETLNTFFDPQASGLRVAAMVVFRWTLGSTSSFSRMFRYRLDDLSDWGREFKCGECGDYQPAIFFPGLRELRWLGPQKQNGILPQCGGCFLTWHLRRSTDHYKHKKRCIIKAWLLDENNRGQWNTTDLRKAIEDYEILGIEEMAAALDEHRKNDDYDHETHERQVPFTDAELRGKRGPWRRSTDAMISMQQQKAFLTLPRNEFLNYHASGECRFDGHGIRW